MLKFISKLFGGSKSEKDVQQLLIQQTNLRYRLNDKN